MPHTPMIYGIPPLSPNISPSSNILVFYILFTTKLGIDMKITLRSVRNAAAVWLSPMFFLVAIINGVSLSFIIGKIPS